MNEKSLPKVAYGQNQRFITTPYKTPATSEYAASSSTSSRPLNRGSRPARQPTHAQANIWNGIHGPTPPLISAPPSSETDPSTNPNPAPNARPASTSRKNPGSRPAVPGPSARNAAPTAASIPSNEITFASIPDSDNSASTTATSNGSSRTNSQGASVV